jgi:hypothetical protein
MSTVPNRYYNSPWIADAARNLASALAPPDQEHLLEVEREKWKFQRLQELSQLEDEQRGLHKTGIQSLGALLADANAQTAMAPGPWKSTYSTAQNPAMVPTMDDNAFEGHINTALAGDVPFNDVVTAAGPRGAAYAGKIGLLDDKQLAALGLQTMKGDQAWQRANLSQEGSWSRAMLGYEKAIDLQQRNAELEKYIQLLKGQQDAASDARTNTIKPPIDISPADAKASDESVANWASSLMGKNLEGQYTDLPADVAAAVKQYTNELYQQTRNYPTAEEAAKKFFFGANPQVTKAYDSWFFDPFHADVDEPSIALRDGKTLAELQAELDAMRASATAAAPASPGGIPPLIAAPGSQEFRVPVYSPEEARALPPDTLFIVLPEGRKGKTPPAAFQ